MKNKVVIKTYKGRQKAATAQFQKDAVKLALQGYYPTTQAWAEGQYGCGDFLVALVLCFVLIGIIIFIFMLLVKPAGTLTVTYELKEAPPPPVPVYVQAPAVQLPAAFPAPPIAAKKYFCYLDNEVKGPFDAATLKKMFFEGRITAETQCCLEGAEEWNNYQDI
jgi:hypothetical protein